MLIEAAAAWSRERAADQPRPRAASTAVAQPRPRSLPQPRPRDRAAAVAAAAAIAYFHLKKLVDLNYLTDCTVSEAIRSTKLFTRTLRA